MYPNYVTVYSEFEGEEGADAFLSEVDSRGMDERIFVDNIDRLGARAYAGLRQRFGSIVGTSVEQMYGFDRYFRIEDYAL